MDSFVQVNLISTSNEIGEYRRKVILPKLEKSQLHHILYLGDLPNNQHNSINLWSTIKKIIKDNIDSEYVIIMEDDCTFKSKNLKKELTQAIEKVKETKIKAIFTGCSKVAPKSKIAVNNLINIASAHNSQLVVIFKELYINLLEYPSGGEWDLVLSSMSQLKDIDVALTLPFLTGQLKTGLSNLNTDKQEEIGERFEIEEQRLLKIFNK